MRLLVLVFLVVGACSSGSPRTDTTTARDATRATVESSARVVAQTTEVVGRATLVLSPDDGAEHPAVIVLHGAKGDPQATAEAGDWAEAVVDRGVVAVFPSGTDQTWNAGTCCDTAVAQQVDDVAYLESLVDAIAARDDVVDERVYLAGHSNGAMMTYRYACESGVGIAGYAVVTGARLVPCPHPPGASLLAVHGTDDSAVPYRGRAEPAELYIPIPPLPSVDESLAPFVAGCAPPIPDAPFGIATVRHWADCPDGREVELVTLAGVEHTWPESPIAATALVLDFFEI